MANRDFVPLSSLSDAEVVEKVLGDTEKAVANKASDFQRNRRYFNVYQALDNPEIVAAESTTDLGEGEEQDRYSNTFLPIIAGIVDTATAQIYNHFFSTSTYLRIEGEDFEDDLFGEMVTAHQLKRHREMKLKVMMYRVLQQMMCFDYCVSYTYWKIRPGIVRRRETTTGHEQLGPIAIPYQKVAIKQQWVPNAIDRPALGMFDYFRCAHDVGSQFGFADSTHFVDWRYEPIEELIRLAETPERLWGKYKNVSKVIHKLQNNEGGDPIDETYDPRDYGTQEKKDRVRVVRYWTRDQAVEVCKEELISRTNLDNYPLQRWACYEVPGQFAGMGSIQRIERPQYDVNAIVNNKRDFQNLTLTPIAVMDHNVLGLDEGDIELYPGKTFVVRTGGDVRHKVWFYQPGTDISQGATEEMKIQIDLMKQLSGFDDNAMGAYTPGRKTARETSAVAAGLLVKVRTIADRLEEDALIEIYQDFFLLDQLYLTQEDAFKYQGVKGTQWFKIRPEHYAWNKMPRFVALGSSHMAEHELLVAQFLKAVEVAMMMPKMHNWENIVAKLWQLLDPKDHLKMVRDPRDRQENVPPKVENLLLAYGHPVEVSPENDHAEHDQVHGQMEGSPDFKVWPKHLQDRLRQHRLAHQQQQIVGRLAQQQQPPGDAQGLSDLFRGMRGGQEVQAA